MIQYDVQIYLYIETSTLNLKKTRIKSYLCPRSDTFVFMPTLPSHTRYKSKKLLCVQCTIQPTVREETRSLEKTNKQINK